MTLASEKEIVLPLHYNRTLQGFIYETLDLVLSSFLHDYGFLAKGKPLKPLTFSRIFGKVRHDKHQKKLYFEPPIYFYVASSLKNLLSSIATNLIRKSELQLGMNKVYFSKIEHIEEKVKGNTAVVKTLSPIVVRKTINNHSEFFSPYESEFYKRLAKNLSRKTLLHLKEPIEPEKIKIEPAPDARFKKVVAFYKRYPYVAYKGKFVIKAPKEAIETALLSGLGEKNIQGFGMMILEREESGK